MRVETFQVAPSALFTSIRLERCYTWVGFVSSMIQVSKARAYSSGESFKYPLGHIHKHQT
jgi:hypothetical protein